MKKLGVALGGGGLKGLAHIGILQVLHENKIPVSFIAGTSAGSIVAALLAAGVSPYAMEKLVLNLDKSDYMDYDLKGLLKYVFSLYIPGFQASLSGFIKGDKIEKLVYKMTGGKKLDDAVMPLAIIACDIDSGREVIFTNQDLVGINKNITVVKKAYLSQAVRASISIPVTFIPARLEGMQLVDGGIKEIIPVGVVRRMGAEYVLSVNLGRALYDTPVQGMEQIIKRTLSILVYETSGDVLEYYSDMVLSPPVPEIGLGDIKKAAALIRIGRRTMKQKLAELQAGLNE
ncbi:NTE family protein [Thermosyntropha lipolytica DSM 11003]|uniref:NTE family protein n=1 Tax=Thermosyntropha lipolytica DSM 11003 TaxID=1123382 RepID=A0A1M5JNM8_9FIRM|nr:patatin-like phospholipase family protein [Thermosyntropha lipolytica]SHG42177.1 NTE family protein [Thermosyntropha lipolytica DSM 11003]